MGIKGIFWLTKCAILFLAFTALSASAEAQSPTFTTLYSFTGGSDGGWPAAGLLVGGKGVLYGTTITGGETLNPNCTGVSASGCGTVFALTPPAGVGGEWTEAVLYAFAGGSDDGAFPGQIVVGNNGAFYGVTSSGGNDGCPPDGCGTAFRTVPPASAGGTWTESVIFDFGVSDGRILYPPLGLVVAQGGLLYGTTGYSAFALKPPPAPGSAWSGEALFTYFQSFVAGGLVLGPDHTLYGTTAGDGAACSQGCGTVFALTPGAAHQRWTMSPLADFTGMNGDGLSPVGGLVQGPEGALYGATSMGGYDGPPCQGTASYPGCGTVFELSPQGERLDKNDPI